ncbi:MAG: hypothetical protein NT075_15855 [Chloroflexi bacterium]|nr:hypothetical protein [Chloroflexota bacterium]
MDRQKKRQPAGRAIPRPTRVEPCDQCQAVLGLNYRDCANCHQAIERFWEADWQALLAHEQIVAELADETLLAQVVIAELDDHLWTIVDMAMRRIRCEECGQELGGGPIQCAACQFAFGNLWWHDIDAGRQGVMTHNEHALRVGRYVIRHPHRYSNAIATGWRMNMPRIVTGWLPPGQDARRYATILKQEKIMDWDAVYRKIDAEINQASDG